MSTMHIFASHSHEDDTFCRGIVSALRGAGADVWYDEHNLGSGQLVDTIERELKVRPVVVVILSDAALASQWVRDECTWAYNLLRRDPSRIILPVTAAPLEEDAIWLFLSTFKRIEAPGLKPFPMEEACGRLLHALALTAPGEASVVPTPTPQPAESMEELLAQGKALMAQRKYTKAIPFFERATKLDPHSVAALANLGLAYNETGRPRDGLTALDRALALDDKQALIWCNKGYALDDLKRYDEALAAYERALAIDPKFLKAWYNKATTLYTKLYNESLAAHERGFDSTDRRDWNLRARTLRALGRTREAMEAERRAEELGG